MNELIETIFANFTVNKVVIPVTFLYYEGHGEPYIVYMNEDADNSYGADDDIDGYVEYYDFDIYTKGNYLDIIESVKSVLSANGFTFQPSKSSADQYETDTGYYHKTLNFAIPRQKGEETNG